jgi:hypothetical protein
MEMFRNMEVVLMLCFGLICTAALIVRPQSEPASAQALNDVATPRMPVVVVIGKRLSAAKKAQALDGRQAD